MKQKYTSTLLIVVLSMAFITESFAFDCPAQGDQVTYGTNNQWLGYVYQGSNFQTYLGYVTEGISTNPNFDQNFGGNNVSYITNGCSATTENFSVRYKLIKTFSSGYYDITVGGDDGYRLSLDGGSTWVINHWNDQSYNSTTYSVLLNGSYNMVIEYYENGGDNRISFSVSPGCNPTGDPAIAGTSNVWRGYLYQGNNFQTYRGFVTEGTVSSPNFNEVFGGANTNFATSSCGVQTENFSARFRLQISLPAATYVFNVGGDDGYRFSLDGGITWVINNWTAHSYTSTTYITAFSGTANMVIEYFENGGDNRVSFSMSSNASLPVKLTSLTAKASATDKVQVKWSISEEVNFNHYIVQRSTGGQAFKDIAQVSGQYENTYTAISYQYTDALNYSGLVHYRLKMVDKDGRVDYSSIVTVSLNVAAGTVKIYPTVVENGSLFVETAGSLENGKVEIFDMHGRVMLSKNQLTGIRQQLSLADGRVPAGTYVVRVTDNNKLITTKTVIVK